MNLSFDWEHLTTLFFALTFVFVILMTVGFFINYKRDQHQRRQKTTANPVQGRFFKRYIPNELKQKYHAHLEV
jgi:hypothetical protein